MKSNTLSGCYLGEFILIIYLVLFLPENQYVGALVQVFSFFETVSCSVTQDAQWCNLAHILRSLLSQAILVP